MKDDPKQAETQADTSAPSKDGGGQSPTLPPRETAQLLRALPFWLSLGLVPLAWMAALYGGWWLLILPLASWHGVSLMDSILGLNRANADPETPECALTWYRAVTLIWAPVHAATLFGILWMVEHQDGLAIWEKGALFFGLGITAGTIGINMAHELMHQSNRLERIMADLLLSMVLYSHFRSEHLLVHHPYVGTSRDAVTARYNEGFHQFYPRVLREVPVSAFRAEKRKLARAGRPWWHHSNPFWRYAALQIAMIALAVTIGGLGGLTLFLVQAGAAIWQLELTNYVEHYGLTRAYLGEGRYEHVQPRHSWNAAHRASNWLLINLQRHSDHHTKPARRFPLLQHHPEEEAPQLPYGYPLMGVMAMIPPLWRRVMNPRVRAWRKQHYPQITDWAPYKAASLPPPRGS